jgi:peptidoglycan glycosyltransferase
MQQSRRQHYLRQGIAWLGLFIGLALLSHGLFTGDTTLWRLHLLVGLWLLSLLPRAYARQRKPAPKNEVHIAPGLFYLGLLLLLGVAAVALQLTRNQVSQAPDIRQRAERILHPTPVTLPQPPPPPTPIPAAERVALGEGHIEQARITFHRRGTIYDRNDAVLAYSEDGRRIYPDPDLGHIVGYQNQLYGNTGVEASFDSYLSGERMLDPRTLLQSELSGQPAHAYGADIRLTLDSNLQRVAQAALGARPGAVVLLEPQSGAILAMATYPRFDPNWLVLPEVATEADINAVEEVWQTLSTRSDSPLLNRATQGRYAPGSIIKTLTAAAALDSGIMSAPESQVTCPNRLTTEPNTPPVRNYLDGLAGVTGNPSNLRRVYAFSCNTAFAQVGLLLGPDLFDSYATRFGLGYADAEQQEPALRDIAADKGTIASSAASLQRPAILADTAYGQGEALVRPLDMAQMVAVIANGGNLMRPYVVQNAIVGEQLLYQAQPEVLQQTLSPQAASQMRSMMQTSVEIGYAQPVALPGVAIGAKTGTAETSSGIPHSWFVALAPVEQPRFAIAVVVENGGEGSVAALPVARQVLAAALGTP